MGRSKNACLSILTCAGAGGGGGDVAADPTNSSSSAAATADCHCEESKVISDKSRWSFRRRSTRHRVLRNNESNEAETVTHNKENSNADLMNDSSNNICSPKYSSSTDKTVEQEKPKENNIVSREIDEKPEENDLVIKESVKETHDELKENFSVEEKEVKEEKAEEDVVVKDVEVNLEQSNLSTVEDVANIPESNENLEQAAVVIQSGFRGYMVRKETSVVKKAVIIQAAARGFLMRSQAVGTLRCLLAIVKMQAVVRSRQTPKKSDITGISQGNGGGFGLGNKTCTSNDNLLLNGFACKILDTMPKTKAIHIKCDPYKPNSTWEWLERWTYTLTLSNASQLPDQKEIIESEISTKESNADSCEHAVLLNTTNPSSNFGSQDQIENPEDNMGTAFVPEEELKTKFTENGVHACELKEENSNPKLDIQPDDSLSCENPELDVAETKLDDGDAQKVGNKKVVNPNFVAAQMKFQELSSNSNLSVSRSTSNSKSFTFPSQADDISSKNDNNMKNHETNNITAGGAMIKAVSECGTEISISSTLDSPDRSEIEGGEIVLEIGALENSQHGNPNHNCSEVTKTQIEAEVKNPDLELQPEPTKEPKESITNSINTATKSIENERLLRSPEGTPISHTTTTVTDMHGTPSSQSSVNTKTTKRERKKKPRNLSTKRSLNSPISDSNNNLNAVIKRHGSIGHGGDAEPRISNSSLPSYMQATESARAKLHPSVSPKLSPDVSETNGSGKKRHSLPIAGPGAGGKDSSPRMQRSQSHQAQADAKGNGTHSHGSSDKRWQI